MGKTNVISADEKRWRAQDDARVMKQMAELDSDKSRKAEAMKIIKAEQKALNKVIGGSKNGKR